MITPENRKHFFDLKIPLGTLLSFYGIVLLVYGAFGPKSIYAKSLNIDVNLIWGIVMLIVGTAFLSVAFFGKRKAR